MVLVVGDLDKRELFGNRKNDLVIGDWQEGFESVVKLVFFEENKVFGEDSECFVVTGCVDERI